MTQGRGSFIDGDEPLRRGSGAVARTRFGKGAEARGDVKEEDE